MNTLDELLARAPTIKRQCEIIKGATISPRTWYEWEKLAGCRYLQGQKVSDRIYTDEQVQRFLCVAYLRKHYPKMRLTPNVVRNYWVNHKQKIDEVLDEYCRVVSSGEIPSPPKKEQETRRLLAQVKQYCDRIFNREISRECWSGWKQFLGIRKYARFVDNGTAALLVFMACWRRDYPNKKMPSVNQLLIMMQHSSRRAMRLESSSSAKQQLQWRMQGCKGKDLTAYLAASGYKVAISTLYRWGKFSQRKHYSVSELSQWLQIAQEKRYGT